MLHGYLNLDPILASNKVVPVLVLDDITLALPIATALLDANINVIEVTLRTSNALDIITEITKNLPSMLVGAGTVLNADQYHKAVSHGARFIVSPGLTKSLASVASEYEIPFLPGAITPTEIMQAIDMGFVYLKYFPAESTNGCSTLKDMSKVFTQIKFCPTGGIGMHNISKYLSIPNVVSVGSSAMFASVKPGMGHEELKAVTSSAKVLLETL